MKPFFCMSAALLFGACGLFAQNAASPADGAKVGLIWQRVADAENQVTDGNWVLQLAPLDNGMYSLGVNSATHGYVSGSGVLDLSTLAADTGFMVTHIAVSAFQGCTALESLILPDSVHSIAENAFQNCTALTAVELSPNLETLGYGAFAQNQALQTVTPFLPDALRSIANNVFRGCSALTGDLKLTSPELVALGGSAFHSCSSLTSVDMGESGVKAIGGYAFQDCSAITNVVLSPVLESVGALTFQRNVALRTVTPFLPETLQSIGESAFNQCTNLTGDLKLTSPALTTIAKTAFNSCSRLTSVDLGGSGVTLLDSYCFNQCWSLTNAVLPSLLQQIQNHAFYGASSLATVRPFLPKTVQAVGDSAFNQCLMLAVPLEITGENFTKLGEASFSRCPLTRITLPDATFSISNWAFSNVSAGAPFYFLGKAPISIGTGALRSTSAANPLVLHACRRMDATGWASYTTALTDADRAQPTYPGSATFGVFVDEEHRNWLVHWNSPLLCDLTVLRLH